MHVTGVPEGARFARGSLVSTRIVLLRVLVVRRRCAGLPPRHRSACVAFCSVTVDVTAGSFLQSLWPGITEDAPRGPSGTGRATHLCVRNRPYDGVAHLGWLSSKPHGQPLTSVGLSPHFIERSTHHAQMSTCALGFPYTGSPAGGLVINLSSQGYHHNSSGTRTWVSICSRAASPREH